MRIILILILCLLAVPAQAESARVKVNGMVCDFCAQGVEKKFGKRDDIADIKVSLEDSLIELDFKEGASITDDEIKKVIADNGLSLISIERYSKKKTFTVTSDNE